RPYQFEFQVVTRGGVIDALIRGILPGTYKLEVILAPQSYLCPCAYGPERFWWPGVANAAASSSIELGGAEVGVVSGRVRARLPRIQGQITGVWQEMGIGPPSIGLFDLDSTLVRDVHQVSEDGSFDERVYLARPVKLLVSHAGVKQWVGGSTFDAATA